MRFSAALLLGLASAVVALPGASTTKNLPRKTFRRPDSTWDYIIHGDDAKKPIEARSASYISEYTMRAKDVDPSSLGVDSVKQISGYLDNNATNKHLFYCKSKEREK